MNNMMCSTISGRGGGAGGQGVRGELGEGFVWVVEKYDLLGGGVCVGRELRICSNPPETQTRHHHAKGE